MRRLSVLLIVLLSVVLVVACAKPAPTPTKPAASPAGTTPAKPATPAASPKSSPTAVATNFADFYKNNTTTIIVGQAAGGANDYAARVVANFWQEAVGGTAQVKNVPAGGGVVGSNDVFKSKPDGLTLGIGTFGTHLVSPVLFKQEGVTFDLSKFGYIGMYADELQVFAIGKDLPYKSVAEMQKLKSLKFGASAKTGTPSTGSALVLSFLQPESGGVITGYGTAPEVGLAIAKKELDGYVYGSGSVKADTDKGFVKPLATVSFKTTRLFPDTPAITTAMKLTPDQEKLLKIYNSIFFGSRVLFAPPGMEPARLQYLRTAFNKMVTLKGFQDQTIARSGVFEPPGTGQDVEAQMKEVLAFSAEDVAKLDAVLKKWVK